MVPACRKPWLTGRRPISNMIRERAQLWWLRPSQWGANGHAFRHVQMTCSCSNREGA
jgi:hypothetical protein